MKFVFFNFSIIKPLTFLSIFIYGFKIFYIFFKFIIVQFFLKSTFWIKVIFFYLFLFTLSIIFFKKVHRKFLSYYLLQWDVFSHSVIFFSVLNNLLVFTFWKIFVTFMTILPIFFFFLKRFWCFLRAFFCRLSLFPW